MAFKKEQYKYVKYEADHLSSYAAFVYMMGKHQSQGEIELFHQRTGGKRSYLFEALIAHPKKFNPQWEQRISPHESLTCVPITSVKYEFKSNSFHGLDSLNILNDYCRYVRAWCNRLDLEGEVNIYTNHLFNQGGVLLSYSLQGKIQGQVRKLWVGHKDLRAVLQKSIGVADSLNYI